MPETTSNTAPGASAATPVEKQIVKEVVPQAKASARNLLISYGLTLVTITGVFINEVAPQVADIITQHLPMWAGGNWVTMAVLAVGAALLKRGSTQSQNAQVNALKLPPNVVNDGVKRHY